MKKMTINLGGGLNVEESVRLALLDGWQCTNGRLVLDDDLSILGYLSPTAVYLTFER